MHYTAIVVSFLFIIYFFIKFLSEIRRNTDLGLAWLSSFFMATNWFITLFSGGI